MPYAEPGADVVAVVDAPPTPLFVLGPGGGQVLLVAYEAHPPVAVLARPFLRLAGVRADPVLRARRRTARGSGLTLVSVADGAARAVGVPAGAAVAHATWSPDGRRVAFTVDGLDRVEVWVAGTDGDGDAVAAAVPGLAVSDLLAAPFRWSRDSSALLAAAVPPDRVGRAAVHPEVVEPHVDETAGKASQMATYQDLLTSASDADRFENLAATELVRVDPATGERTPVAAPGLIAWYAGSPDGRHVLVGRLQRPFSFRVPYQYFARRLEVWSSGGAPEAVIADLPVADQVPRQGVPPGPRHVCWDERAPATVLWLEALDGGDPVAPADHRDRLMAAAAPFDDPEGMTAREVLRTRHRCTGWANLDLDHGLVLTEYDRDRRWQTTWVVPLDDPGERRVLFDLSANDAYANPGRALRTTHPDGTETVLQEGTSIFLRGAGATPAGNRPFLDRHDLAGGTTERLHASAAGALEPVIGMVDGGTAALVRRESPTEPPNLVVVPLTGHPGDRRALTAFADPHPHLTGMTTRLRTHRRPDGVALSGVLHLPPGHDPARDGRLPLVLWAYPREFNDAGTAGQVRASDQCFPRLAALVPVWFVLRGYAVLADATMPVLGDPETMNDTYIEQVTAAARAHVDALDADGIVDRSRVVVGGHSYGAFMTANLLAHTDLFAAGIARSGAYNRTLTPFGFQSERRTYWEAPRVYDAVSPFHHADRITAPLLLIHGAADDNPGTFPVQSERLFQALQGNGGTARLVLLPHEGHGYLARESVLHLLAEQFDWVERWAPPGPCSGRPAGAGAAP
jgi:dipeptidyl aminopeptidase/acylaminoacyl peptidase